MNITKSLGLEKDKLRIGQSVMKIAKKLELEDYHQEIRQLSGMKITKSRELQKTPEDVRLSLMST